MAAVVSLSLAAPQAAQGDLPEWFVASPERPLTNEPVTFTTTLSSGTFNWDLDGDHQCDDASGPSVQTSYPRAGAYPVTLCVTDVNGQGSRSKDIIVLNRPPVASFTFAPRAPMTGDAIDLFSLSADSEGPIASQAWDLDGDGVFDDASGPTAEWSFADAGSHPVRLLVTDQNGATAVATADLPVVERPAEAISPFPLVRMTAAVGNRGTRIRELIVRAPVGARVRVRCRGRRCPFRSFARMADVEVRSARIVRIRRLRKYLLRPGTVIEIRVTKHGEVGKFTRFRIRRGMPPVRTDRCLPPGAKHPKRCPSG